MPRPIRPPDPDVATLPAALRWLRSAWMTLPTAPSRLHQSRTTEGRHTKQGSPEKGAAMAPGAPEWPATHPPEPVGTERLGAPPFSPAFARVLFGRPTDVDEYDETVPCDHLEQDRAARVTGEMCPRCRIYDADGNAIAESGTIRVRRQRYRSPMAAALWRLSKVPKPSPSTPAPIDYIVALYYAAWEPLRAARMLGLEPISADHSATVEAMLLLAIRQLHSRYSAGPVARVADQSESQRNAEDAA